MKRSSVFSIIGAIFFFLGFPLVHAQAACPLPSQSNINIGANTCTVAAVTGAYGVITLDNASSSLTINNGGELCLTSMAVTAGSAAVQAGGLIKTSCTLYMTDTDSDGYPANTTMYDTAGTGRRAINLLTSISNMDCNDGNAATYANLVCYPDADSDGYYSTSSHSVCGGASCAAIGESATVGTDCDDTTNTKYATVTGCYNDNDADGGKAIVTSTPFCGSTCANSGGSTTIGTDCCDDNNSAYSGQTNYFTTGMTLTNLCPSAGARPFDYNCSGTEEHYYTGSGVYCTCSPNSSTQTCDTVGGSTGWTSGDPGCGNTANWKLAGCCNPSGDCTGTAYPACAAGNLANYNYTQKCR